VLSASSVFEKQDFAGGSGELLRRCPNRAKSPFFRKRLSASITGGNLSYIKINVKEKPRIMQTLFHLKILILKIIPRFNVARLSSFDIRHSTFDL